MQVKLIYNRLQFNLMVLLYIVMLWCKKNRAPKCYAGLLHSVLARNEEFSKIAVIKFFFSSQKKKVICGGGFCGEIFLSHANQKFNTCLLTCRQTRKIYEHSHRPVCQYIAPCVIIALNVIAIDKYTYNMLFIFCYNPLEVHE